jgi:hypothetical protein
MLAMLWAKCTAGKQRIRGVLTSRFTGSLQHMECNKNAAPQLLYQAVLVLVTGDVRQWHAWLLQRVLSKAAGVCTLNAVHLGSSYLLLVALLVLDGSTAFALVIAYCCTVTNTYDSLFVLTACSGM